MSKIILINCPPWGVVMPPLGIAYLSAYLRAKGIDTVVNDLNLILYQQADKLEKAYWNLDAINKISPIDIAQNLFFSFKQSINEYIKSLADSKIIGFSANNMISAAFCGIFGAKIKQFYADKIIIVGGPGVYHSWDRNIADKTGIDFFVIGEGEEAFFQLVKVFIDNQCTKLSTAIPGVLSAGKLFSPRRVFIKDINSLPFPTFKEFDLKAYNPNSNYHPLPMLLSRGCINRCSYCVDWYMCWPFRTRKKESVIAEIKHHLDTYGVNNIEFNDLLCNGNLPHIESLCESISAENFGINWISYAAIRKSMSDRLMQKMKQSGCNSLCYGVESGSDFVLKRMNKNYTKKDAANVLKMTHNAGILTRINIIVGFPGETNDDFQQTLDFIYENKNYISEVTNVSAFVFMPGSDLGIYPHKFGIRFLNSNLWTDEYGLSQKQRIQRVDIVCKLIKEIGIKNLIINCQEDIVNPSDKKEDIIKIASVENITIINEHIILQNFESLKLYKRPKVYRKTAAVLFLFIFSLLINFYLQFLKKNRKSIIFPGT